MGRASLLLQMRPVAESTYFLLEGNWQMPPDMEALEEYVDRVRNCDSFRNSTTSSDAIIAHWCADISATLATVAIVPQLSSVGSTQLRGAWMIQILLSTHNDVRNHSKYLSSGSPAHLFLVFQTTGKRRRNVFMLEDILEKAMISCPLMAATL